MAKREGFPSITPYVVLKDAERAIEFYQSVLGAQEISCHKDEGGGIMHAEIRVGDSPIMITGESDKWKMYGPLHYGGSPIQLFYYLEDPDALFKKAIEAGCSAIDPMADKPYGRAGGFRDPFGVTWWICGHVDDTVSA